MAKAMEQLQRELQDLRDEQTATKAQLASVQAENGRLEQKVGSLEADLLKATKDAAEQKGRADILNQSMSAWQGHATTDRRRFDTVSSRLFDTVICSQCRHPIGCITFPPRECYSECDAELFAHDGWDAYDGA